MEDLISRTERLPDGAHLFGSWGADRELAAQTVEMLQTVILALAALGRVKRLPKFRPIPRPARRDTTPAEPRLSPADKIRQLARTMKGPA